MSLYSYFDQKLNKPDLGLLALRAIFGLLIFALGVSKLLDGGPMFAQIGGAMAAFGVNWHPKWWGLLSALTETFGGLAILLGIFFRPAALLLVFNMIVACTFMVKFVGAPDFSSADAFDGWLGKIDPPFLFCAAFLAVLFTGPGKYAMHKSGGGGRGGAKSGAKE
jgi:putative oxidoreductase